MSYYNIKLQTRIDNRLYDSLRSCCGMLDITFKSGLEKSIKLWMEKQGMVYNVGLGRYVFELKPSQITKMLEKERKKENAKRTIQEKKQQQKTRELAKQIRDKARQKKEARRVRKVRRIVVEEG